jgi:type II secretory pathway pseudopilin PulG
MLEVHHLCSSWLQVRQRWTNQRLLPPLHLRGNEREMSLVELLVTLGIVAITGVVTLPRINSQTFNAKLTAQNLLGYIRMARASATTRGAHFRVTLESTSYTVERLQDDDGNGDWEPGSGLQKRTVDLPSGNSLSINNGDGIIEFMTRGLITTPADGTTPEI